MAMSVGLSGYSDSCDFEFLRHRRCHRANGPRYRRGGLVGVNAVGAVDHSFATGNVTVSRRQGVIAGGLVGFNYEAKLSYVYATGSVMGDDYGDSKRRIRRSWSASTAAALRKLTRWAASREPAPALSVAWWASPLRRHNQLPVIGTSRPHRPKHQRRWCRSHNRAIAIGFAGRILERRLGDCSGDEFPIPQMAGGVRRA